MIKLPTRDDIHVGSIVHIICKNDQKSGKMTKGIVKNILTKSYDHPYGIKVEIEDDKIGRVQKIIKQPRETFQNNEVDKSIFELFDQKTIPDTEDTQNEFKEFYQYDDEFKKIPKNTSNRESIISKKAKNVQKRFVIAICSFANSKTGGFVYIGINDNGDVVGLEKDMKFGKFLNYSDKFANHIRDTLEQYLQNKQFVISKLKIEFIKTENKTICKIQILPSDNPLFFTDGKLVEFYVRGPTPRAEHLTGEQMAAYIMDRFQNKN